MRPAVDRDRQPDIVRRRCAFRIPIVTHVDPGGDAASFDLELVGVLGIVGVGRFGSDVAGSGPGAGEGSRPEDFVWAGGYIVSALRKRLLVERREGGGLDTDLGR